MAIRTHRNQLTESLANIFERVEPLALDRCVLSGREAEILSLSILGLTDEQISQSLEIRLSTVNSYWVRIRGKMGPYSRTQIVAGVLTFQHRRELQALEEEIERLKEQLAEAKGGAARCNSN